jgi:hypothetical protein
MRVGDMVRWVDHPEYTPDGGPLAIFRHRSDEPSRVGFLQVRVANVMIVAGEAFAG